VTAVILLRVVPIVVVINSINAKIAMFDRFYSPNAMFLLKKESAQNIYKK